MAEPGVGLKRDFCGREGSPGFYITWYLLCKQDVFADMAPCSEVGRTEVIVKGRRSDEKCNELPSTTSLLRPSDWKKPILPRTGSSWPDKLPEDVPLVNTSGVTNASSVAHEVSAWE